MRDKLLSLFSPPLLPQTRAFPSHPQDRFLHSSYVTCHHGTKAMAPPGPASPRGPTGLDLGRRTHALVEHVRLVPQLRVLAKVLPYHLHPLHLQPLQLLARRKPTETSGGCPFNLGTFPLHGSLTILEAKHRCCPTPWGLARHPPHIWGRRYSQGRSSCCFLNLLLPGMVGTMSFPCIA